MFLKSKPVELDDLGEEAKVALFREIESYLKAGGMVTPELWTRMEPAERAVFIYAKSGGAEKEITLLEATALALESKLTGRAPEGTLRL